MVTGTGSVAMAGTGVIFGNSGMAGCGSSGISIGVPVGIFCGGTELNVTRRIGSWESVRCAGRRSLGSNSMMAGLVASIVVTDALFVRSILIFGCVDRKFARCAFMCPFSVAWDLRGCLRICFVVRPGKVVRKPVSMALHMVCRVGDQSDA